MIISGTSEVKEYGLFPHGFVYYLPIIPEIPLTIENKYKGLSLQEIEEKYGNDEAQYVYNTVASGGPDLTEPQPISCDPISKIQVIDWEFEISFPEDGFCAEYTLVIIPNGYFTGHENFKLTSGVFYGSFYKYFKNLNNFKNLFYLLHHPDNYLLKFISPTLDYHEGPLGRLPIASVEHYKTCNIAEKAIRISTFIRAGLIQLR